MNKWFYFNFLVFIFAFWKVITGSLSPHIIWGTVGLSLILFNWTRHAVFSTLRSSIERKRKIKYANLSKKVLPFHKWTGTSALCVIIIHAVLVTKQFGFQLSYLKIVVGLLAGIVLIFIVLTGWLRLYWPSVRKRFAHLWLGLSIFFLIILHLIL